MRHLVPSGQTPRLPLQPAAFKQSCTVIIPKPGKVDYSSPKAYWPIALLNTLGKLIEKLISVWMQFEAVRHCLVHSHQLGGLIQQSTTDADLFLTHVVRAGWSKGLVTSVVAFDIAQFFPSLNHTFLLATMRRLGFSPSLVTFFESYLVGRVTQLVWGHDTSEPLPSSVIQVRDPSLVVLQWSQGCLYRLGPWLLAVTWRGVSQA